MHQLRTRSLKPEWRGSGLLTRRPVDRNHSRPPWTSYRSGRTGRTLNPLTMPIAGSNPAWSSMCLYPNGRGNALRARSVLVRVEPGTPVFVDRDDRSRSSRSPAIALRCYASGEAARLSIERDGFESRTARHFGTKLGTPKPAVFPLETATSVRSSTLLDPMMRTSFASTSTR